MVYAAVLETVLWKELRVRISLSALSSTELFQMMDDYALPDGSVHLLAHDV